MAIFLKDEILKLRRKYKFVNKHRYFYNRQSDLSAKFNKIMSWSIVQSKNRGTFVFELPFVRRHNMSIQQWTRLWTTKQNQKDTLFNIITEHVLPNISVRFDDNWRYVDLIGWAIKDARRQRNNRKMVVRHKRKGSKNVKRI